MGRKHPKKSHHSRKKPTEKKKTDMETIKYPCVMTEAWEKLEKESLMGYRVFTRGIWYALTIFSILGLLFLSGGRVVLFSPVTIFFAVMLLKCLFFDDYPDPTTTPVLKNIRFVTSLIILPIMFYVPFYYPTMDVFVSTFSFLAGGVSIYHLTSTIDIGHGLLILLFAFINGLLAIDFAGQDFPPGTGLYCIAFFQYIVYVYNFEFLAKVVSPDCDVLDS